MHCQHAKKKLTPKQAAQANLAKGKNAKTSLMHDVRQKKTGCLSSLKLTVTRPTKKNQHGSSQQNLNCVSHPTVLTLLFNHNHPIDSAHALSFRPIDTETKEKFYDLFRKGHTASSAHHWHETSLFFCDSNSTEQLLLADRALNPTKSDVYRLYDEWRRNELGPDDGKPLFDKLREEIEIYNSKFCAASGIAKLQCFQADTDLDDSINSTNSEPPAKRQKKKRKTHHQPLLIAICTPLMSRIHKHVQQAGEIVYCDATSSLDRFNTSLFTLSTSTAAGGLPLGVIISSDEQQENILEGLSILKSIIPQQGGFFGHGAEKGPDIIMTDDCTAERNPLHGAWPSSRLLLCVFHFLQQQWTWLHDGSNCIANGDRKVLIKYVKNLVYAESEECLIREYTKVVSSEVTKKYPKFLKYLDGCWRR